MFHAAYDSAWQQPGIALLGAVPLLLAALTLRRQRLLLLLFLEVAIVLDAVLTGPLSPLSAHGITVASSLFVVLGDLRFLYLVRRQRDASRFGALARALAFALVLPLAMVVAHALSPTTFTGTRAFLVYESLFVGLALWVGRSRGLDAARAQYTRRLTAFVVVQYALWALSDAFILAGHDAGWLLRVVPNGLYYVAFVAVATLRVPADVRT